MSPRSFFRFPSPATHSHHITPAPDSPSSPSSPPQPSSSSLRSTPPPPVSSFSPPAHPPRLISPNQHRSPAALTSQVLRPNVDIGASLQDLLNGTDDGKNYTLIGHDSSNSSELWRSHVIRIYFQNVNGLRPQDDGSDILDAFYHMETIRADIFGFVETKLDCQQSKVQELFHSQKRKVWPHCKLQSSSSSAPWHSLYKPGGTLLGVTGPLVGRVKRSISDELGRWSIMELLGRGGRSLVLICAYQVCKSASSGSSTAYSQQLSLLRQKNLDNPDPRKHFVRDLTNIVSAYHKQDSDIILMGDFNEVIGLKADAMASVVRAGQLTDTQIFCHGLTTEDSTYARGPNRVDYIFASARLLPFILRQGCEPFNARIFSDHRAVFLDLSYPGIFDRSPNVLASPPCRHVLYNCPRHIQTYLQYVSKYSQEHSLLERACLLTDGPRDDDAAIRFDNDLTKGMLAAEAACKRRPRSPWSMALHDAMSTKYVLARHLSQLLTKRDMSESIQRLQAKLPEPIPLPASIPLTQNALRRAQTQCRHVVRNARNLRKQYQQDRIDALQLAHPDDDPDHLARRIKHRDAISEMWKKIPSSKPRSSGGISMLKVPRDPTADPKAPNTEFRTVVDPVEMETLLLARNMKHFRQAEDTPLASPSLSSALGWGAQTDTAEALLSASTDSALLSSDTYAAEILAKCRRLNPEASPHITLDQLQQFYLKWRVSTSTAPSGRHLSHYHLLFHPHGISDDDPSLYSTLQDAKTTLWKLHHTAVDYGTTHGFCFPRWQNVVTTMIEKEPGNPSLHRLRVIHLYENDYNAILGIKFREVVHKCNDNRQFNPGCYGSLANKQSLDPVYLEVMQYDYAQLTRWDSIKFANDAGSCYDRIIASPSNLIARSRGLPQSIAAMHGQMLQFAKYRIKTQLGISLQSYSHSDSSPVHGTGQGSCSSPLVWALNCSLYFDVYFDHCYGANYRNIDSTRLLKVGMAGFVDDNGVQTNCHPRDRHNLLSHATHDAQLWSDILWSSGGILEHDKCSYHYLCTDFDKQGAPVFRAGQHSDPILIRDHRNQATAITQLSAYQPYKTLGTYQCPGHAQTTQYDILMKKSHDLVRVLSTSACQGHSAWLFYSSVYIKSVGYPLAVSRLTEQQFKKILGPMVPVILNRLSYEKSLPHALAFGPRSHNGLGLPHLHSLQITAQVTLFIRHLRSQSQPGHLSKINLDLLQYTAGVSWPVLRYPSRRLPHLEGTWLPPFRESLVEIGAHFTIADIVFPPVQREFDRYIMDIALAHSTFSDTEIRYINYCRLFLQCLTISDLCAACGTRLTTGISTGDLTIEYSTSLLDEPHQERPGPLAWTAWRKLLKLISFTDGSLRHDLGLWLHPVASLRRRWPFVYSSSQDLLFQWKLFAYDTLSYRRSRVYNSTFLPLCSGSTLPPDCIPIDAIRISDGWRIGPYNSLSTPTLPDLPLSFHEYLATLPDHERSLLLRFQFTTTDIHDIVSRITTFDDIILVSDGGAIYDYGSFGWTLGDVGGSRFAQGSGAVFGHAPNSYRAEITGCKAGLLFLIHAFRFCDSPLPSGRLQFHCDNYGFIKKMLKFREYELSAESCGLHSEWDLLISVHHYFGLFPELPSVHHVLGHQDRDFEYADLDLPAQMNVDADALCSTELHEYGHYLPDVPFDPISIVQFCIDGRAVTRDYAAAIESRLHLPPLRIYLCQRFHWTPEIFSSIDWTSFSSAYSSFPRTRTFFYKFGWKKLPCGERLHRREGRYDDRCPCCLQPNETDDHIFQCLHPSRRHWRLEFLQLLRSKFSPFLDPELLDLIVFGLKSYFQQDTSTLFSRFPNPSSVPSSAPDCPPISPAFPFSDFYADDSDYESIHTESSRSSDSTDTFFDDTSDSDDSLYDPDSDASFCSDTTILFTTDPYIALRQAQDHIGWDHFLRGKFADGWTRLQYHYALRTNKLKQSQNWQIKLIKFLANQSFTYWCTRNKARHGHDKATSHAKKLEQAHRDITAIYALRDKVLPQDQELFFASLELHLLQPYDQLRSWLQLNRNLIQFSVRAAASKSTACTPRITKFFQSNPNRRRSRIRQQTSRRAPKSFQPSRMTKFYSILPCRSSKLPAIRERPVRSRPTPPAQSSRPRQRYLYDFFPNHPG